MQDNKLVHGTPETVLHDMSNLIYTKSFGEHQNRNEIATQRIK